MSQVGSFNNGSIVPPGTVVETIQGNTGGPIAPDGSNNINVVGDGVGITITGNPLTHTLVASLIGGGDAASTFITDDGTANASGSVINVITDNAALNAGSSVLFSGTGNTVTFNITDNNHNTMIGLSAGSSSLTGTNNTALGYNSGSSYTGTESSNILINSVGVAAESNVLRIGSGTGTGTGELNESFISGIRGITPATADGIPVFIGSTGQLGTVGSGGSTFVQTVTGNTGGAVSPLTGNINIKGDGTTIEITGNPLTNTLTVVGLGGGGGTLTQLSGDTGFALPTAGIINIITDNSVQGAGSSVLFKGSGNTILFDVTDANSNTIIGLGAGNSAITGTNNTTLGEDTAFSLTTGSSNVMIGKDCGSSLITGLRNILLGTSSGSSYISNESNNIIIGSPGVVAESNALHIGSGTGTGSSQLNKAFISGIRGITPATTDGIPVFIGSAGQLGTVGNGGTTLVSTLTGNTGGAVGPLAGNINIVGDGTTIEITGNPGTNTLTVVGLGGGGGTVAQLSGDTGFALPTAGIINVITGNSTQNAGSSVYFAGSGNTLELNVTDGEGNTLIGLEAGNGTLTGTKNTGLGVDSGRALTSGSSNIFLGYQCGNLITTGTGNFLCGDASLQTILKGSTTSTGFYAFGASTGILFLHNWGGASSGNTFVGFGSGSSFNAGQQASGLDNTACGKNSLQSITTAVGNTAFGSSSGTAIKSGLFNTFIGLGAGSNYTSSESSNICIGSGTFGISSESNTMRIGAGTGTGATQLNRAFVAGIRGITPGAGNGIPVFIDSNGQLGTVGGAGTGIISTLTGNTGGAVGPSVGGNINVVGDGTSINVVGNPGTNRLTISAIGASGGPSFVAYLTSNFTLPSNVTTKIPFDTVPYNQGGAYNAVSSIFTAPTTGLYNFSCGLYLNIGSATRNVGVLQLLTSSNVFQVYPLVLTGTSVYTSFNLGNNFYTNMTAGDTAQITMVYNNGSLTTTVLGVSTQAPSTRAGINTFFSGMLV